MHPEVSIITVTFNSHQDTLELLACLDRTPQGCSFEVIVVDNGSQDPFQQPDQTYSFPLKTIFTGKNLGFSGGNNAALHCAEGQYLFFLNNDTLLTPDCLKEIKEVFLRSSKIKIVSPKICFAESNETLQYAGCTAIDKFLGRGFARGSGEQDQGQYNGVERTERAHGAAMMIPKDYYIDSGCMYDPFFLYYEEMDYCQRVVNSGDEIWYTGKCKVYHKESMSVGKRSPLKAYYIFRNRMWFMWRNFTFFPNLVFAIHCTFIVLPRTLLDCVIQREPANFFATLKGFFHGWIVR